MVTGHDCGISWYCLIIAQASAKDVLQLFSFSDVHVVHVRQAGYSKGGGPLEQENISGPILFLLADVN